MPKYYGSKVANGSKASDRQELYDPAHRKVKRYSKKLSEKDKAKLAEQISQWGVPGICSCCKYCNSYDQWCRHKMGKITGLVYHCPTFIVSRERLADIEMKKVV